MPQLRRSPPIFESSGASSDSSSWRVDPLSATLERSRPHLRSRGSPIVVENRREWALVPPLESGNWRSRRAHRKSQSRTERGSSTPPLTGLEPDGISHAAASSQVAPSMSDPGLPPEEKRIQPP